MKVILATDPIFPPLTGIGRYTLELAQGLAAAAQITQLKCYNMGRWQDPDTLLQTAPAAAATSGNAPTLFGRMRSTLARSNTAVALYGKITPVLEDIRLAKWSDYLYHSPNFFLPRFNGVSVTTIHDLSIFHYPAFHPPARVAFMQERVPQAVAKADHIITISNFIANQIVEYFNYPRQQITVTPLGVSEHYTPQRGEAFRQILARHRLEEQNYFLSVATLEPRKNISGLLRAYQRLPHSQRQHTPLVLCGSAGWNNAQLLQEIQQGERGGWLRVLGYLPEAEMPALYSGAKGFIFPSFYEGFGLPVLEAFACGCPVITSRGSALTELAEGAALLINPHDEENIAQAILQLSTEDPQGESRQQHATRIAAQHTWSRCVEMTIGVYQKVAR